MDYSDILYAADSGIATITINRPDVRNAVRPKTYEEAYACDDAGGERPDSRRRGADRCRRQSILRGRRYSRPVGAKPDVGRIHMRRLFALSSVMRSMDKPIVAKVRGFCVGGGNEINLFCDMTIASDDAKFGETGPRVGSVSHLGACQLLARYVGERKAREMVFTCRLYTAQQALEMGLINEVCPAAELDVVAQVCDDILSKSPQSVRSSGAKATKVPPCATCVPRPASDRPACTRPSATRTRCFKPHCVATWCGSKDTSRRPKTARTGSGMSWRRRPGSRSRIVNAEVARSSTPSPTGRTCRPGQRHRAGELRTTARASPTPSPRLVRLCSPAGAEDMVNLLVAATVSIRLLGRAGATAR